MNTILRRFSVLSRFVLAIVLGALAIILSGMIVIPFIRQCFPFTITILLIIATWIMYRTDNQTLKLIGLDITGRNIGFLLLGLAIGIVALGVENYLRTLYIGEAWPFNSMVNTVNLWQGLYFILPTVAMQELIFRGYLFTKTIEVSNIITANIAFGILFMLMHVLDRNVLHNLGQLIFLAISIPVGHLLFATALLKSKTLLFPIGLHWGNNWASSYLLGTSKNEYVIFYTSNQQLFTTWTPFIMILFIFNGFFLLVSYLIWKVPVYAKTCLNKL